MPMKWPHLGCFLGWSWHCVDSWAITWLTDSWPWPKWCCGSWLQFNGVLDGTPAPGNVPWQCLIYQQKSNLCLLSSGVMLNISNRIFFIFLRSLIFVMLVFTWFWFMFQASAFTIVAEEMWSVDCQITWKKTLQFVLKKTVFKTLLQFLKSE